MVITTVEGTEIKTLGGHRPPQAQPTAGVHPVAEHRHIVGDAKCLLRRLPAHPQPPIAVVISAGTAAKAHAAGFVGVHHLPGPSTLEPLIGDLHLPTVFNQLIEDAKFVADAITGGGDLQAGQRFHVTRGQTAQSAITQAGLLFHHQDAIEVAHAKAGHGLLGLIADTEHQQVVAELGADQEFSGKIGNRFGRMQPLQILVSQMPRH